MEGLRDLVADPKLQALLDPAVVIALGAIIVGIVQGIRGRFPWLDSSTLPWVSALCGVFVLAFAMLLVGVTWSGQAVGFLVLFGLAMGLGTTGVVTVSTHWGATTTRDSTSQQP